ncbi:MAG TPA: hypothetical protein VK463_19245, partial [Desulfomonilaceae bacterium]|nr:hypothetical protein [Desulfomonilaceae bacterium]
FMDGGCTVNVGISLFSRVSFRTKERGIRIASEDLNTMVEAEEPAQLPVDGPLGLLGRAVRALPPPTGLEITTRNDAPAGSGLGASSALLICMVQGLLTLRSEVTDRRLIISLGVGIETSAIGVPAGSQDHIAAAYGGVSVLEFGFRGFVRNQPTQGNKRLEDTMILSYTGEGRFSGMNNWEVTKSFIEGTGGVREKLIRIRDLARETGAALLSGEWAALPRLVDEEWHIRKTLAPGVSTPQIDAMMTAARNAGALANKICGAGGGGCMITLVESSHRESVEQALANAGGRLLPFSIDTRGLSMTIDA